MTWEELDWKILERLRGGFIGGAAAEGPYWRSEADLAHYDFTFARRIGWKWDAVLRELEMRSWSPRGGTLLDWACGSGIAGRKVLAAYGAERFDSLLLWDHSPLAVSYSEEAVRKAHPSLNVCSATPGFLASAAPIGLLVVSHVLNELPQDSLAELRRLILRSQAVLWVEAGTHEVSRGLQTVRDALREEFAVIAPCTHQGPCGLLAGGNERHWCHFFAPPPSEIYGDPNWVRFGQRAGIDLRSLPYAFLALEKKSSGGGSAEGFSRVIGRPEFFKPYARLLNCDATGIAELEIPKRAAAALYKELERSKGPLVRRWQREGDKILGIAEPSAAGDGREAMGDGQR